MPSYKNRKCQITKKGIKFIDYKNVELLEKYVTKYNKIIPRYYTGSSLKHQKQLSRAIKNARYMAMMPYTK